MKRDNEAYLRGGVVVKSTQECEPITWCRVGARGVMPQFTLKVVSSRAAAHTHAGKLPRAQDSLCMGSWARVMSGVILKGRREKVFGSRTFGSVNPRDVTKRKNSVIGYFWEMPASTPAPPTPLRDS